MKKAALTRRAATAADYANFGHFFLELGIDDPIPTRERWERELMPHTLFLEEQGTPVAYALANVAAQTGHLVHCVVAPDRRRQGIGRELLRVVLDDFLAAGCTDAYLSVKADNAAAIRLYERFGFRTAHASTALAVRWSDVPNLPRSSRSTQARIAEPARDAAIEALFELPRGHLAHLRTKPDRILIELVELGADSSEPLGFAAFTPTFPGALPFRVREPGLGRALLEAMLPYRRPEHEGVNLVVEDSPELAGLLRAAGARLRFELLKLCVMLEHHDAASQRAGTRDG